MNKYFNYLFNEPLLLIDILLRRTGDFISDVPYLKARFRLRMGYNMNLQNPVTFAEKLQWLKLYDRKTIYHQMVDKYDSKVFVNNTVGSGYTIPTLGLYDSFEQIDWDSLPQKFVLKATHDSGSYYIVNDKDIVDKSKCKKQLYKNWYRDYYYLGREWQYKGLRKRIIAEPLLVDSRFPYLRDFKFYCFNGEPKIFYITSDRGNNSTVKQDFFDIEGNHLDLEDKHYTKNLIKTPDLPAHLDEMVSLARLLSKNTYHLRVDFYEIEGKIYVGELTFHEDAGFCSFKPESWNYILGSWITIPKVKN